MKYNISHLYYTVSAKQGGHGIFATSLLNDENREISPSYTTYTPPSDAPYQPSDEEIIELFPVNKAFFQLKSSHKQALLCTRYTGRCNHTPNRFGNFLSHIVAFDEPLLNVKLPLLLEEYPFRTSLTIEEEKTFKMDSPQWTFEVNEQKIRKKTEQAVHFLNEDENRKIAFAHIIDEILGGRLDEEEQNIVIKASSKEDIKTFIYSLYTILPSCWINTFSFATYLGSLRNCPFQIVGIIPGSAVDIKDNSLLFDLTKPSENYYQIKNYFTAFFDAAITSSSITDILEFETAIQTMNINRSVLNHISKRKMFYHEIVHKTCNELIEILKQENDTTEQYKLLQFVLHNNSNLIYQYLQWYATEYLHSAYSFDDKTKILNNVYKLIKNSDFPFYEYYLFFKKQLEYQEQQKLSIEFLINYVGQVDITVDTIEKELESADNWFANHDNDSKFNMLNMKYPDKIKEFLHLNRIRVKKEINKTIKNKKFISSLPQFETDLLNMELQHRVSIFVDGLLSETVIGKFDTAFTGYLKLIEKYFAADKYVFWKELFNRRDSKLAKDKHSISWLKKQFVIATLNIDKQYAKEIAALLSYDEKNWLLEYYRERLPRTDYSKICVIFNHEEKDN
jgi:hypothetical protein